jgi:GT2 family glycosyltransferase
LSPKGRPPTSPTDGPLGDGDAARRTRAIAEPAAADDAARLEAEVATLSRALERQMALGRRTAAEAHRRELELAEAKARLKASRDELNALRRRRPVRLVLGVARRARAAFDEARKVTGRLPVGHPGGGVVDAGRLVADEAAERRFLDRLAGQVAGAPPETGSLVSILMLNRDGAAHLRRNLPALAATAYRDVELIVVDNASSDDSLDVLRSFPPPFPIRIIENAENASFSAANNQGVEACRGELILFLNNDIEPIGTAWLGHMVETLTKRDAAAVGARLIYPRRTKESRAGLRFPDLSLQHGGVGFRMDDGLPIPEALGAGDDATSEWAAAVRDAPALTAACLLVRREAFAATGGFDEGYDYGLEDVDLCLRLRDRGGRLVYDGRAALWHHESATRVREERVVRVARTTANRDRFVGIWAPRLYRTVMLDGVEGDGCWRSAPFHVAVDGGEAGALDEALDGAGWRLTRLTADVDWAGLDHSIDAIVTADDARDIRRLRPGPIRIAHVLGDPTAWLGRPWFEDFDIVIVSDEVARERIATGSSQRPVVQPTAGHGAGFDSILEAWLREPRIGIRIAVPSWDVAARWGDLHVARDLQRALARLGRQSRIHLRPEWDAGPAATDDVSIHLLGQAEASIRSGQLNVLWHLSHPDRGTPELYGRYDLAFAASDSFARWMATQVRIPVAPLHQATDPQRFAPGASGPAHELLFVANSRGVRRHLLDDLLPTEHDLAVYGKSWTPERLDPKYLAGEYIPNEELAGIYAAAAIVLNDHWLDMQREGFMSNRLYDAAAAGAFVISDDVDGLVAEFDGGIVGYVDAAELRELIDHYLAHPDERRDRADRARRAVLERHTFDHRARRLLDAIEPVLARRPLVIGHEVAGVPVEAAT